MQINTEVLIELYLKHQNITKAAREYCNQLDLDYSDSFRRKCSKIINREIDLDDDLENISSTKTVQYPNDKKVSVEDDFFMPSAWDSENNRFLSVDEYCDKYNLPKESVRSSKLIAHNGTHMVYNMVFNPTTLESVGIDEAFIEEVVKKHIQPIKYADYTPKEGNWVDRLVLTDIHIGMDVNGGRNVSTMYEGKWDRDELLKRVYSVIRHVKSFQKGSTLIIDELGDLMDGLLGYTTRGGHELPQNMNDKEAFELAVEFKITLIEGLKSLYDKIVCNNITEDNHSGIFGYFVNSTIKHIIENRYPGNVEYNLMERFMNHYSIGNHTFILAHGKDSQDMKFSFKAILDVKQAEKIDQYCKENKLYDGSFIEFSKGDSHQFIMDYTTSNDFEYCTYPAFSPPSNWVKTNFKKSKSGFVFFNIDKESNTKVTIPYWF